MTYSGFHEYFEAISRQQTRSISSRNSFDLPDGDYVFLPMFCDDKKCDCRRTLINVLQVSPEFKRFHAATLSYGWEPKSFYKIWSPSMDENMLNEFKGPAIDYFNQQSKYSEAMLKIFVEVALDENYIERLKKQYAMFKYRQGMNMPPELLKYTGLYEPCPCGSGNTFKFCCGKSGKSGFSRRFKR
jgi:SEC-C motif-containing protein